MNIKDLEEKLDKIAKKIEKDIEKYFPGAKFHFTHEVFSIYKAYITIEGGFPVIGYRPLGENIEKEITEGARLFIIASVSAFNRKQTVLVRCVYHKGELERTREPVEVLDTEFTHEEEREKKEGGIVILPPIIREYQHEIVGFLIQIATEIALKMLGL